jgi:hypothetical protein
VETPERGPHCAVTRASIVSWCAGASVHAGCAGWAAHGDEIATDVPEYTGTQPLVQISEIL